MNNEIEYYEDLLNKIKEILDDKQRDGFQRCVYIRALIRKHEEGSIDA